MKLALVLIAALFPAAALAQVPASITVTSTHYCYNGQCHSHEYDMLQHVAAAAKAHQTTLGTLRINGFLAEDSSVRTVTVDGTMPMPMHAPLPPNHPPGANGMPPMPPPPAPNAPPDAAHMTPLTVHMQAQYRGTTLLRAAGELRDANGRVVERFTVSP